MTNRCARLTKRCLYSANGSGILRSMIIALVFLLGIVNFTLHSAALDSGHPMMSRFPGATGPGEKPAGLRITLLLEFAILLAAMWLSANGWPAVVLGYAFYSALNGVSAWAILTGKV